LHAVLLNKTIQNLFLKPDHPFFCCIAGKKEFDKRVFLGGFPCANSAFRRTENLQTKIMYISYSDVISSDPHGKIIASFWYLLISQALFWGLESFIVV
jgi:hypothetical protein